MPRLHELSTCRGPRNPLRARPGQVMPLGVIMMLMVLLMIGLAVDAGRILLVRHRVQQGVDAAAHAGGQEIDLPALIANPHCIRLAPAAAATAAQAALAGEGLADGAGIQATPTFIAVSAGRSVPITLLRAVGVGPGSPIPAAVEVRAQARVIPRYTGQAQTCPAS